ncbi:hypothetical protein CJF30_00005451 [Rutstroemia sp. NJR-2017a BBW]|nr:hypothetical protein CJF30_00005933 [Rutstroemia sp. NJR-2017a BBW]PQE08570.1 hypothetical protein CJF30_00005451 [Rutstroemia sp. NJR-2017a BBW]
MDSYAQAMGQSPFFYYNPDPKSDNRQHGHFSQQPSNVQIPMYHQHAHQLPSTPIYSRPNSSCSQPPMPQNIFNAGFMGNMTPMASPRPMYQKPTILIQEHSPRVMMDSENEHDMYYYPTTPPLSASASVMSSPSSCDILPTPVNSVFFGVESFEGVKEGCESEVQSENLAGGEWARCGSPPMTPVFIHPNSLISNANELLSATSCPSLSPSPSPYPRSVASEQDFDFCDPRNLTVGSTVLPPTSNPTLISAPEFPPLPTLCAGDDEEHRYMLGGSDAFIKIETRANAFDFTSDSASNHTLPTFDHISELDSEDDFVNGLVNFPTTDNVQFIGNKRQRTGSDLINSDSEIFVSEDDFEDFEDFDETEKFAAACLPSPPASRSESEPKKEKRAKKSKAAAHCDEDSSEFDSMVRSRKFTVPINNLSGAAPEETTADNQQSSTAPSQSGSSESNMTSNMMASGSDAGLPQQAPVNRRGRKQSLTDDPSKTFVCDLCSRRFRRQEHLKRHYRSLHTQEKPFECGDCGKKFSRSDNLSQHARTHGSGAIVMGVLEDGELPADHMESGSDVERIRAHGNALYNLAAQASGSESSGTDSESDGQSRKERKRKRSE